MPRYRVEMLVGWCWLPMLEADDYRMASAAAMDLCQIAVSIRIVDCDREAQEIEPVVFQITQGLR